MAMRISRIWHHFQVPRNVRNISALNGTLQKVGYKPNLDSERIADNAKVQENSPVLFHDAGAAGLITLNRPNVLNAIKKSMSETMIQTLTEWEYFKKRVLIEGAGDKAFSAGGDLTLITKYTTYPDFDERRTLYFGSIYTLMHTIGTYKTPIIALMNNVTMGNGAGVSTHAKYRIVTERSIFAMPEVSLGTSPDGGSSYIFPRLEGKLGLFLGMTGYRLRGADIVRSGIASHFVPSAKLPDLKQELLNIRNNSIDEIIEQYQIANPSGESQYIPYMEKINHCFSAASVEEIMDRLKVDGSGWAKQTLRSMNAMSPLALKVFHEVYRRGKDLSFTECVKMEFRVSCSMITPTSDFTKGVAALISKTKPEWNPATLKDVTEEDVLRQFEPMHPDKEKILRI